MAKCKFDCDLQYTISLLILLNFASNDINIKHNMIRNNKSQHNTNDEGTILD